jgi:hypothetical protein
VPYFQGLSSPGEDLRELGSHLAIGWEERSTHRGQDKAALKFAEEMDEDDLWNSGFTDVPVAEKIGACWDNRKGLDPLWQMGTGKSPLDYRNFSHANIVFNRHSLLDQQHLCNDPRI